MSLEERIEEAVQERFLIVPSIEFRPVREDAPVSNRMYSPLDYIDGASIVRASVMRDNETSVMAPMGTMIHLGRMDIEGQNVIMDDMAAVPRLMGPEGATAILGYNQIPNMIDAKPAFARSEEVELDFGRLPNYGDYVESVEGQKKEVEQVLGLAADPFIRAMLNNEDTGEPMSVQDAIYSNLSFLRRGWCETDTRFLQLLPYITFYKKSAEGDISLFVYQRGQGVGEERLAKNCSVGAGGHVNPIDFLSMQSRLEKHPGQKEVISNFTGRLMVEAFWSGIVNNVFRELGEEVKVQETLGQGENLDFVDIHMPNFICDQAADAGISVEQWLYRRTSFFLTLSDSAVEEVHLGMFIAIEVPESFEISTAEESLHDVGFVDLDDLYGADGSTEAPWATPTPLECWSRHVVNALYETRKFIADNKVEFKGQSKFVRRQLMNNGEHLVDAEVVAKIPAADRWKIGTISSSFGDEYRFYAMNAFLRA